MQCISMYIYMYIFCLCNIWCICHGGINCICSLWGMGCICIMLCICCICGTCNICCILGVWYMRYMPQAVYVVYVMSAVYVVYETYVPYLVYICICNIWNKCNAFHISRYLGYMMYEHYMCMCFVCGVWCTYICSSSDESILIWSHANHSPAWFKFALSVPTACRPGLTRQIELKV